MTIFAVAIFLLAALGTADAFFFGEPDERPDARPDATEFLKKYGYLSNDLFTSNQPWEVEKSLRAFQNFTGLEITGELDEATQEKMKAPRCGVSDVIQTVVNFDLSGRKWDKKVLTYKITQYTNDLTQFAVNFIIDRAFQEWAKYIPLRFSQILSGRPDIEIKFGGIYHGDDYPFDNRGGVLAHAFLPTDGDIHFDDSELWTQGVSSGTNLFIVAVHEIGHALGLLHSEKSDAIMAPYYPGYTPNAHLNIDDIKAIQKLYPYGEETPTTTTTKAPTTTTKAPTTTTKAPTTTTKAPTTTTTTTKAPTTTTTTTMAPTTTTTTTMAPTTTTTTTKAPTTTTTTTMAPTTTTVPTTQKPAPPKNGLVCPFPYQAVMLQGSKHFGFKSNGDIDEIDSNGHLIGTGNTKKVADVYPPVTSVNAAAYSSALKRVYLISGSQLYTFTDGKQDANSPKNVYVLPRGASINGDILTLLLPGNTYMEMDAKTLETKQNQLMWDLGEIVAAVGTADSLDFYTKDKKISLTAAGVSYTNCA